jgi:hypothetical protein
MIDLTRCAARLLVSVVSVGALVWINACTEDGHAGVANAAQGGDSGASNAAAGEGGDSSCEFTNVECCATENHLPCEGLDESECSKRNPFCFGVLGAPWTAGDGAPWSESGGAGGLPQYPNAQLEFVGCASDCGLSFDDAYTCVADPTSPGSCYWTTSWVPDGWEHFTGCEDIPAGFCGY